MQGLVLIVDDEPNAARVLSAILAGEGHTVLTASDASKAEHILKSRDVDAIITDLRMPGRDGMQLFEHVAEHLPDVPVIFLTAYGTVDSAVNAITRGAFYYFIKPPDYVKLKSMVSRAVEQRSLKREVAELRKRVAAGSGADRIIGVSPEMLKIFNTVEAVKDSMSSVLVCGETGTGKELIARSLHYGSVRRDRPFVAVNCAAIPRELMESELFGYEKGAFSGAAARRIGRFEAAADGTIFLDEIGELPLNLQVKLLRFLQEKVIQRVGGREDIAVDARIVAATNVDIARSMAEGTFREDLFYRIGVVSITLPPLRSRGEDVMPLANLFLKRFSVDLRKKAKGFSSTSREYLEAYAWPGNVRELENKVQRAVLMAASPIIEPDDLGFTERPMPRASASLEGVSLREARDRVEREMVREAISRCKGNIARAAEELGISRPTIYDLMKKHGVSG